MAEEALVGGDADGGVFDLAAGGLSLPVKYSVLFPMITPERTPTTTHPRTGHGTAVTWMRPAAPTMTMADATMSPRNSALCT